MDYRVVVSQDAKDDLEKYVSYLTLEKCNMQAAVNLLDDCDKTIDKLSLVAGNLKFCDNTRLKDRGYKRINFLNHKYFMLFRVEDKTAYVDRIYHFLQDYENKIL